MHHVVGVNLLVRLRLGFNYLHEHKFRYNTHDTLSLVLPQLLSSARPALMNNVNLINPIISQLNETDLVNILLYCDSKKYISQNCKILQSTIKYTFATKWFNQTLF